MRDLITPVTRAVVAVHLGGNACDVDALMGICRDAGLVLIEDCAQAHGATYRGRAVGTWGDYGCYSLNEFKHISCGDGGLVVGRDAESTDLLRRATDKAYSRSPSAPGAERNPTFLANNYRMTELQGAVGRAQLRKLSDIVARRRAWCGALLERLEGAPGVLTPGITPGCEPSWWFFMMRVDPSVLGVSADDFAAAVSAEGIPVGAHYIGTPVYAYPVFTDHSAFRRGTHPYAARDYRLGLCPVTEEILDTTVILGVSEAYGEQELDDVADAISRVAEWYARRR